MTDQPDYSEEIDKGAAVLLDLLKVGAVFYPPLSVAIPLLTAFISYQAAALKQGLANGTILPDGQGGFVPSSNSRYNPINGKFI